MKVCNRCDLEKELEEFSIIKKPNGKVYYTNKCKKCKGRYKSLKKYQDKVGRGEFELRELEELYREQDRLKGQIAFLESVLKTKGVEKHNSFRMFSYVTEHTVEVIKEAVFKYFDLDVKKYKTGAGTGVYRVARAFVVYFVKEKTKFEGTTLNYLLKYNKDRINEALNIVEGNLVVNLYIEYVDKYARRVEQELRVAINELKKTKEYTYAKRTNKRRES